MTKSKKLRVYCAACGKILGTDPKVVKIEKCCFCRTKKRKKKRIQTAAGGFARVKKGPAKDLPEKYRSISFRSTWERNFARVLCARGVEWTYERAVFSFHGFSRRPFQYIPDFHETESDVYWEVKGYLRSEDRSKMKRFRKQYPEDFKKLKACLSKSNKKGVEFYGKMGIEMVFIEDLKAEWTGKVAWEG
jgi:hypothetical protein